MPKDIFSFIWIVTVSILSIVKISTSFWIFRSEFSNHSTVNCGEIFWIKMRQNEIGVSSQSAIFAIDICINQFGNKLRCECNDESLKLKSSNYFLNKFKIQDNWLIHVWCLLDFMRNSFRIIYVPYARYHKPQLVY